MTKADVERLRKGIRACAEMQSLAGATEVMPGVHGVPESIGRDQLALVDRAPLDPRASVVDPQLRVHGVRGLYVMDASVFPANTGVNPQHSIMAIALVAARRLAAA
jgi:hypothetical protein